ncbi:GntR family transcriptional regulator [Streptomyces sp. NPDC046215]|uniref:HTH gntR-type domain-containing protein n=1 Tax=Streptomyces stramineus TaxID=173861 RepID=A0ABN0ZZW3_9ACTN
MEKAKGDQRATARSIADDIRAQIRGGTLPPGAVLPTSRELASRYGVSHKTVSAGIDVLKVEGLVVGERGGRRRVRASRPITWNLTSSTQGAAVMDDWATAIKEAGREPAQTLSVTTEGASGEVAAWLHLDPGEEVVRREHLRTVDGRPFQLVNMWFPAGLVRNTPLAEEREVARPAAVLAQAGHPQQRVRDEIDVRMPTPEEAEPLGLPPGTPVAEHVRTGHGNTTPIYVVRTIAPGDRHRLVYELGV